MIAALSDRYRVVLPAYPETPKGGTLTPDAVTAAIADTAGVDSFAFWGHSWGAVIGLQLAIASDRVSALAVSGFPPLEGPYEAMLHGTGPVRCRRRRTRPAPGDPGRLPPVRHLLRRAGRVRRARRPHPAHHAQADFVGSDDHLPLGGDVVARFGETVLAQRDELQQRDWQVQIVPDRDHATLINADPVCPVLGPFLDKALLPPRGG